uniref:Mediator complex subunit 16 n=1 Tax=Nomascus leucogenys TaxID=61853 RepID=A0A2I3HD49_NOMLE
SCDFFSPVRLCHHAQVAQQDHGGEAVGAALDQELPVRWALVAGAPQLPLSPPPAAALDQPSAAPEPGCRESHCLPWTLLGTVNLSPPCRAVEGRGPDACMTNRAAEEVPAFVQLGPRSTHRPPTTPRSLDHPHPEDRP